MKLTKVVVIGLVASGALVGATMSAQADVVYPQSANTTGSVDFRDSDGVAQPVDPTDPDGGPVSPVPPIGTTGLLRLDQVPTFDFGTVDIKGAEVKTGAKYVRLNETGTGNLKYYVPAYVQLTDERGSNAGWTVTTGLSAFTAMDKSTGLEVADVEPLVGATITMKNGQMKNHSGMSAADVALNLPTAYDNIVLDAADAAASKKLMGAETNKGMGIWTNSFYTNDGSLTAPPTSSDVLSSDSSIELAIPGTAKKSKDYNYVSTITWTVASTPDV